MREISCAFGLYSTHSHCRATESNPNAEGRFRVVIPLASPVPADRFSVLWKWAAEVNGLTPDEQAKDLARMFYTPVKASEDAAYAFHVEGGAFLDWSQLSAEKIPPEKNEQQVVSAQVSGRSDGYFAYREDRHSELIRRVTARANPNSRGNYDAACRAHNGKGQTSLVYFPRTGSVTCNNGCDYAALLRAEGLLDIPLPSKPTSDELIPDTALSIVCMADVKAEDVAWLWSPYIPLGKLTILEGDPSSSGSQRSGCTLNTITNEPTFTSNTNSNSRRHMLWIHWSVWRATCQKNTKILSWNGPRNIEGL